MPGGTRVMVAPAVPRVLAAEGVAIELMGVEICDVVKPMEPGTATNAIVIPTTIKILFRIVLFPSLTRLASDVCRTPRIDTSCAEFAD